ncbi:aminoacyl-histidine dipeptidase [Sediminispirochaeta smaragdinae]|uniref:Cytosol non-specific dipeptidase n=1 Tax=Sediminispirochaeta smaragdinae (strain DSM 11293 / JCM 15392 / SEBR 4228) TaxID=573413 RepID=E1R6R2_SEDSS|nr:aminoacyl-histidine dipeptidase [Sediminispirochaeta smaragdinae]ADK79194.1 aminoacyl-histidine dipeptidase [Sediminispirochaeta smaragdinae DSM 11293]
MNNNPLEGRKPASVWHYFQTISKIPRCSCNEAAVRDYVRQFAEEHHMAWKIDAAGNIAVKKGASVGKEAHPGVVLQGHLDMVCEKNRTTKHDFTVDPIKLVVDGDWLKADGTTLGADNGIAVAMALAVLASDEISHGPIEVLFTVDEETGLTGAMGLDPSIIEGKILLNLDSEEPGVFYIGCAGGVNTEGMLPITSEAVPQGRVCYTLTIEGLQGGHSGGEIHLGRGNAIDLVGRLLWELRKLGDFNLVSINGGGKHNAIPRECHARFTLSKEKVAEAEKLAKTIGREIKAELGDNAPGFNLIFEKDTEADEQFDPSSTDRICYMLRIMPHGVAAMSRSIEGLVETSTNFAAIETQKDCCSTTVKVLTSQRSSIMSALDDIAAKVNAAICVVGGQVRHYSRYPAWTPNPNSKLLAECKRIYRDFTGEEAVHAAIHAGLECGVIGDKLEGMEMISFGPEMLGVHTPEERLNIPSVEKLWGFLIKLLENV